MWRGGIGPLILGVEAGPCWVGVGVPAAGQVGGEPQKVEVVVVNSLEVARCLGVALGVALGPGLGEVGGWVGPGHSAQAGGRPQSCTVGGCH